MCTSIRDVSVHIKGKCTSIDESASFSQSTGVQGHTTAGFGVIYWFEGWLQPEQLHRALKFGLHIDTI